MQNLTLQTNSQEEMSKVFLRACDDFGFRNRLQTNAAAAVAGCQLQPEQIKALETRKFKDVRLAMMAPEERPTVYVAVNVVVVVTAVEVPGATIQ